MYNELSNRDQLIVDNMRAAVTTMDRFIKFLELTDLGFELDDLHYIAYIELINAVDYYLTESTVIPLMQIINNKIKNAVTQEINKRFNLSIRLGTSLRDIKMILSSVITADESISEEDILYDMSEDIKRDLIIEGINLAMNNRLSVKERDVLIYRWFREYSLNDTAREFGLHSGERIRQIEAKALRKLRHPASVRMIIKFVE